MSESIPVLVFHTLENKRSIISFPPEMFRTHMERLYRSGYRTLALSHATEYIRNGVPFPERTLGLTFDDGFRTVYTDAFPILEQLGMNAIVFLTVGANGSSPLRGQLPSQGGRAMLNWAQIREMQRYGISFGSHTLTHPDLTSIPQRTAEAEMRDSKAALEPDFDSDRHISRIFDA